jgi:uncharacterized protein (DUF1499 family)
MVRLTERPAERNRAAFVSRLLKKVPCEDGTFHPSQAHLLLSGLCPSRYHPWQVRNVRHRNIAAVFALVLVMLGLASFLGRAPRPASLGAPGGTFTLNDDEKPNWVCSQAPAGTHHVKPLAIPGTHADAIAALGKALSRLGRTAIISQTSNYIHAECTTALLRFVDDLELVFDDAGRVIHVKSASRVGRSDLGTNRRRVETLRRLYEEELSRR